MSGILFATDLDKTLLDDEARVPPICVDAIRSYVQKGGLFTIATGRPTRGALLYPEIIDLVNAPIITYNGAWYLRYKKKKDHLAAIAARHISVLAPSRTGAISKSRGFSVSGRR